MLNLEATTEICSFNLGKPLNLGKPDTLNKDKNKLQ